MLLMSYIRFPNTPAIDWLASIM